VEQRQRNAGVAAAIYPNLRGEARPPVEQRERVPNASVASAIYPHLSRGRER
jgi:hypothetical protein